jgi:ZIP family zinc transporter
MIEIVMLSVLAGVVGMGVGSVLTASFGSSSDKMISIFLSFAGGVMLSIVFMDLLPEALGHSNIYLTIVGLIFGVFMVLILNNILDKISKSGKFHSSFAEFFHEGEMISSKKSMLRSGMIMLFAIALHNIPEGLAMGAAGYIDTNLGFTIALLIGLHNIPEGMAISAPLIAGGVSKLKTIVLVMIAGATTLLGTLAGIVIGEFSDYAISVTFSLAGGAMLYIVFSEILPHCVFTNKDRFPSIFVLVGVVVGMLFSGLI